ncbi:hypothetical protein CANMA_002107 [Candida margitis]|uniref:uncharacterized protein n=1 Tax=Candida margitis TaxID=1775924 RepID=UPI002226359A|nr:uncharacterized protein CANMA_002107 [Candida margitis]KAI5968671.1 hypothetical protein CANMA_002107 [Candida margitis]
MHQQFLNQIILKPMENNTSTTKSLGEINTLKLKEALEYYISHMMSVDQLNAQYMKNLGFQMISTKPKDPRSYMMRLTFEEERILRDHVIHRSNSQIPFNIKFITNAANCSLLDKFSALTIFLGCPLLWRERNPALKSVKFSLQQRTRTPADWKAAISWFHNFESFVKKLNLNQSQTAVEWLEKLFVRETWAGEDFPYTGLILEELSCFTNDEFKAKCDENKIAVFEPTTQISTVQRTVASPSTPLTNGLIQEDAARLPSNASADDFGMQKPLFNNTSTYEPTTTHIGAVTASDSNSTSSKLEECKEEKSVKQDEDVEYRWQKASHYEHLFQKASKFFYKTSMLGGYKLSNELYDPEKEKLSAEFIDRALQATKERS